MVCYCPTKSPLINTKKGNADRFHALPMKIHDVRKIQVCLLRRGSHADAEVLFGDFGLSESEIAFAQHVSILTQQHEL